MKKNGKVIVTEVEIVGVNGVAAVEETTQPEAPLAPLFDSVRKVLLAYVGGVAMAWDETEAMFNKMIERGEVAEQDARQFVNEVVEKRKTPELDGRVEELLNRMNIPSKADIEMLNDRITMLARKLDDLKKVPA